MTERTEQLGPVDHERKTSPVAWEADEDTETLREAVVRGDAKSIERTAHALKSSCATVGAGFMAELGMTLEAKGHSEDLEGIEGLLLVLEEEFDAVRRALARELESASDDTLESD